MHKIELNERILHPEDGYILGNGDLSVSVYQTANHIIWRFGKGDVWDRRQDLSVDPKPAHIDEIIHGIEVEGWTCAPYGGSIQAKHGSDNPQRMKEICQGVPPSYINQPYPCPKPVGELAMMLPPDQMGLKIMQRLTIEEARIDIVCTWPSGLIIRLECYIHPVNNVLVVHWEAENWGVLTRTGYSLPPVWFSLYRWADPSVQKFTSKFEGDFYYVNKPYNGIVTADVTPLPPPVAKQDGNIRFIEQNFPPDPLYPDGFNYLMSPCTIQGTLIQAVVREDSDEARLHIIPKHTEVNGWIAIIVTSSSDDGGALQQLHHLSSLLVDQPEETLAGWKVEVQDKAREFWSKSTGIHIVRPTGE